MNYLNVKGTSIKKCRVRARMLQTKACACINAFPNRNQAIKKNCRAEKKKKDRSKKSTRARNPSRWYYLSTGRVNRTCNGYRGHCVGDISVESLPIGSTGFSSRDIWQRLDRCVQAVEPQKSYEYRFVSIENGPEREDDGTERQRARSHGRRGQEVEQTCSTNDGGMCTVDILFLWGFECSQLSSTAFPCRSTENLREARLLCRAPRGCVSLWGHFFSAGCPIVFFVR